MNDNFLLSDKGVSISIKKDAKITIKGVQFEMEGTIRFLNNVVHLKELDNNIVILIDENEVSKNNYYTSISKDDIYSIWYKGENIWRSWIRDKKIKIKE